MVNEGEIAWAENAFPEDVTEILEEDDDDIEGFQELDNGHSSDREDKVIVLGKNRCIAVL